MSTTVEVNRAPVITLWAAVVAERLGFERGEALTLGRAVCGLNAQTKGQRLGVYEKREKSAGKLHHEKRTAPADDRVELLGRSVPVISTPAGLRAAKGGKPDSPESVEKYLEARFGESLAPARRAMERLAAAYPKDELAAHAFSLYESFRPGVPGGTRGWGARGVLDLARIESLARERKSRR